MHVLVTGHTGFKGAWLSLLLGERGFDVSGIALDPDPGSLFEIAEIGDVLRQDVRQDIRDRDATVSAIRRVAPDVVIHMAAQPLVRRSYAEPRLTIESNVMGTLSVLEGIEAAGTVSAAVMVTTDKVYRNVGRGDGYEEADALGGRDPYSASKSMADILVASWAASFDSCPIAIARAGNVIGGGDVSKDRLVPDLIRGFMTGEPARLRNTEAVRPWQHVLDCLNGYLLLVDELGSGAGSGAWNFGPDASSFRTVRDVADHAARTWGHGARWISDEREHPHEEAVLTLNAQRARRELGWRDVLDFDDAVDWTVDWYKRVEEGSSPLDVTQEQIKEYESRLGDRR